MTANAETEVVKPPSIQEAINAETGTFAAYDTCCLKGEIEILFYFLPDI